MKKAIKKQPRMKSFDRFELQYAATLMQTNRREEAYEILLPILDKHPYDIPTLQMTNDLSFEVDDAVMAWITSFRLTELLPDESIGFMNAVIAASQLAMPFTVVHYADLYLQRWGNKPDANDVRHLKTTFEKVCEEIRKHDPENTARPNAEMSLIEYSSMLVSLGEVEEGRKLCEKAIEIMPDVAAPYNNLALSYATEGNLTEALRIGQQTYERFPNNVQSRCNLAQYLARTGQQAQARELIASLFQTLPTQGELLAKLIETLSYLGDDAEIVSIYKRKVTGKLESTLPIIRHLIAVALARTGDRKTAEKLWKAALKDDPDLLIAEDNLADLKNRVGKQNGAWAFPFTHWFPTAWIEKIADFGENIHSDQAIRRGIERIIHSTVGMETALPIILERGDPYGREFVIRLSQIYPVPGLAEFVQSANGTDEDRALASEAAVNHELLPRGTPVKVYERGKQIELLFLNYEVHGEPDRDQFPKHIQRMYKQSTAATSKNNFDEALQLAQDALVLAPNHPVLMNQIALSLIQLGKSEEGEAILRQNAELNPDYLFARCGMANICIREGKLEEAKTWIAPILKRSRFHYSEFKMLARTQFELLMAEGNRNAAQSWLNMLEDTVPDLDPLPQIKRKSWLR